MSDELNRIAGAAASGALKGLLGLGAFVLVVLVVLAAYWQFEDAADRYEAALKNEYEYDLGRFREPNVLLELPPATEFRWDEDAAAGDVHEAVRACQEKCRHARAPATLAGRGWTYLLIVPSTSAEYGRYARAVKTAIYDLFDATDSRYRPLTIAFPERATLGYREVFDFMFARSCSNGRGACFESIIRLDGFQQDADYGRFNDWLRPLMMDLAPADGHPMPLPVLMVVDDAGMVRFISHGSDPYAVASALLRYFGLEKQLFEKGLDRKHPRVVEIGSPGYYMGWPTRVCGTDTLCFFDDKAASPVAAFFQLCLTCTRPFYKVDPILVPGLEYGAVLDGPTDLERSVYRMQAVGAEAVKALSP